MGAIVVNHNGKALLIKIGQLLRKVRKIADETVVKNDEGLIAF